MWQKFFKIEIHNLIFLNEALSNEQQAMSNKLSTFKSARKLKALSV